MISSAFLQPFAKIKKKIAFENAEAKRLERERLERERIEKERLAAIAKAEFEEAERRRKSLEDKKRLENEMALAKKTEEERIAAEKARQEREKAEIKRIEEERIRAEKERKEREEAEIKRIEEEKRREAEEAERKRIAEMSAVELTFPNRNLKDENESEFINRLKNDLSIFLLTVVHRFEIGLSAGSLIADVRCLDPTEDENHIIAQQKLQAKKEAIIDASLPKIPEIPDVVKSLGELSITKLDATKEEEESNSHLSESSEVSQSNTDTENNENIQNVDPILELSSMDERSSLAYVVLSRISLAKTLRDKCFSTAPKDSLLHEVSLRVGRNCEPPKPKPVEETKLAPPKTVRLDSQPSPSKSADSIQKKVSKSKEKKPAADDISSRLFLFSLSSQTDHLNPNIVGFSHGAEYFPKILNGGIVIPIINENEFCIAIQSPEIRTDTQILLIPKTPLRKAATGIVSPGDAERFQKICIFGLVTGFESNLSIDGKAGIILDHDKKDWHVVRVMEFSGLSIGKQLVHDVVDDWHDWRAQLINETILCYSKTGPTKLNLLCESLYKASKKCGDLTRILINHTATLPQKHAIVNIF